MHSEAAWSQLDTKPVILYLKNTDSYIAYWCGIGMTFRQALCIASNIYFNIWPSPKMKQAMWEEFVTIYYSNGFKTRNWDNHIDNYFLTDFGSDSHYSYLSKKIINALSKADKLKSDVEPKEVLNWFRKSNAINVD